MASMAIMRMVPVGRGDADDVNVGIGQQLLVMVVHLAAQNLVGLQEAGAVNVADGRHVDAAIGLQLLQNVRRGTN